MAETRQLVNAIVDGIQEKKGKDITIVNLQKILTAPAAYFVICTGGSPQQVDAIADSVEEFSRKNVAEKPAAMAGKENAEWIAMDYGTVMVHIFRREARDYYDLENLWDDAELTKVPALD